MATLSVETCQRHLDQYLEAELAVLGSQSYTIGGRTLTRANLKDIRDGIKIWSDRLDVAKRGRTFMRRCVPHGL